MAQEGRKEDNRGWAQQGLVEVRGDTLEFQCEQLALTKLSRQVVIPGYVHMIAEIILEIRYVVRTGITATHTARGSNERSNRHRMAQISHRPARHEGTITPCVVDADSRIPLRLAMSTGSNPSNGELEPYSTGTET